MVLIRNTTGQSRAQTLHRQALRHLKSGALDQGEALLQEALALEPKNASILNTLGKAMLAAERPEDAAGYFGQAVHLRPDYCEAQTGLAQALHKLQNRDRAEQAYRAALDAKADHVPALAGLAILLNQTGRKDDAIDTFRRITTLQPDHPSAWFNLIALTEFRGDLDEAEALIREARRHLGAESGPLGLAEARLLQRRKTYGEAAALLKKLKNRGGETAQNPALHYQLGKSYDALDRPDEAFTAFETANALLGQSYLARHIDRDKIPARLNKLAATVTAEFVKSWTAAPPLDHPSPVFLVGFPRSGTTLLDQILSSHPAIRVAEEKPALQQARDALGDDYPDNLATLPPEKIAELRRIYFDAIGAEQTERLLIDKMPLNLHDAVLAHRLFPQAQFILALRHPCDCVLSCFMQDFVLNAAMIHFLSLEDAADFYDRSFRLWEQYRSLLPLQVHTIRYEDLVADFRGTVGAMLDFLDLPWTDSVLEYDRTAREKKIINTPSYHQVTEKIYGTARYRWLRYADKMPGIASRLEPWIKKYGYG